MYKHEPENYDCPFCRLVRGESDEINDPDVIVYRNDSVTVYVSPKWWPKNSGHVIVIPNGHFENIYSLPNEIGHGIFDVTKDVAIAFKEVYKSDGVSTRQHNEPVGNQDVWHYHVHVFPRYEGDELYLNHKHAKWVSKEERMSYVERLKKYFENKT